MKKFSFLALAAVGLLLGACSDKDEVKTDQNGPDFTDGAFIGVTLQLPSAKTSTRANENFEDGDNAEFEVKNATLYIFKGTSEDDAAFVGQYVIGTGTDWEKDGGTNVTSTYSKATQISNELAAEMADANNANNYYAYVIVNNPGVDATVTVGSSFSDFKEREWSKIGSPVAEQANIGNDGLLMTNAPVCASQGGTVAAPTTLTTGSTVNYSTLVELDKTKVYATESSAISNPAGCIFIERAAAKITVATANGLKVGGSTGPTITFNNWQIINYPSTFYNTRKVDPAWGNLISYITALDNGNSDITDQEFSNWNSDNQYRFVSNTTFNPKKPDDHTGPFRTYFAEDPTYTTNGGLIRPQAVDGKWIAMDKAGYTVENTFDVEHQIWQNTTMVTFKATIEGGDFYTVNGGDDKYTSANALNAVQNGITNIPAVKSAINNAISKLIQLDTATGEFGYTITVNVAFEGSLSASIDKAPLSVSFTVTPTGNATKTADQAFALLTTDGAAAKTEGDALVSALATAKANYKVSYYKEGVTYYNARIQHFGEYETPWSATKPFHTVAPGTTVQQIYGVGETNDLSATRFLGRYGVVRDNWYKLSVDAVNHIGTAEPINVSGDGKNTPDDEIENYLSVHVHILPWVIRNQSITF